MSRSRPNSRKEPANGQIEASFLDPTSGEETVAGVMINSNVFRTYGNEVQASLSRVDPTSYTGERNKSESSSYFHIQNAANPFFSDSCGIGAHLSIELCQKAFYSFPSFRNPILMQSYLANSPIQFQGNNKKIVKFYQEWAEKAQLWDIANQFFLEWFRSGNIFVYRFEGDIKLKEAKKIADNLSQARNRKIPLRYIILNPVDIRGLGSAVFSDQAYGKVLNNYEVSRLRNPQTEEDRMIYDSLDQAAKDAIRMNQTPILPLDINKLRVAFNAKQSYEPMAVPPYFGVLEAINFKQILRSAETKVATSADHCILLITAGEKEGGKRNEKVLTALASLFSAQSVGRVLFADYTAKAEFITPDFNKIFGKEKYITVDNDIINGMNDIMAKDENFATGQTKTKIYLQLLSQARESFLTYFLIPELKNIAEEMGFDEVPEVEFEEITLDSLIETQKNYNRLYELGFFTAEDLRNAYKYNQMPLPEVMAENQKKFKADKKSGLYEPLIGGGANDAAGGRPTGTGTPKKKTTVGPKGGKASIQKIKDNLPKMNELSDKVQQAYKVKNSLARISKKNKEVCDSIWEQIIITEAPENWNSSVEKFINNPFSGESTAQYDEIIEIAAENSINLTAAAILYHSFEE